MGRQEHIDVGKLLSQGKWIVLLVEYGGGRGSEVGGRAERLAVIEMPPFGDAGDPPAWALPSTVMSGRLDPLRDWFATTPVAMLLGEGVVLAAEEGGTAESPDPSGRMIRGRS